MKKFICFDVNGTLVNENSWEIFTRGDKLIEQETKEIFDNYYSGKTSIEEAWKKMVITLRKTGRANKDFVYNCWDEASTFKEGVEDIINYLKGKGYKIYLISCSIDIYLECMVKKLSLDGFYAGSHLIFDSLGELEQITSDCGKGNGYKKEKLKELSEKEGINIEDIIFVGDGDNDVGVFEMTKHGIAMGDNNEKLLSCSWRQIKSLREIKNIL
ncbi:MAG: HAD-IB family phosphatase [Candidatus Paceibacterota bacterium]|jgi:HAD superfamily phosphoserine phosphatase-like hydrolase